jgi:hypothetical protein
MWVKCCVLTDMLKRKTNKYLPSVFILFILCSAVPFVLIKSDFSCTNFYRVECFPCGFSHLRVVFVSYSYFFPRLFDFVSLVEEIYTGFCFLNLFIFD